MKFVKIIIIIIILFFNYEIFSDNYMQCIITHYEIEKTDKIKNEVNKIEFNQDGTKRTEKTYQVNYFNILELFYISVYEYPDKNTIILYYNTKETRAYKTIYKYNDLNKLVSIIEYSC